MGNCITPAYVTGDSAAERHRGRPDGRGQRCNCYWLDRLPHGRKQQQRASLRRERKACFFFFFFVFQLRPHTGFLLDDRWHASHPAHCRYHSAPAPHSSSPPSPPHLSIWLLPHPNFTPRPPPLPTSTYIHTLSISLSACLPLQRWSSSQVC